MAMTFATDVVIDTSHVLNHGRTSGSDVGDDSLAYGDELIANHKAQVVFGEYNVADTNEAAATARGDYVEIVGNGTSTARSNARTLDWDGNQTLAGNLAIHNSSCSLQWNATDNSLDFVFA